jgi:hypothetical protein
VIPCSLAGVYEELSFIFRVEEYNKQVEAFKMEAALSSETSVNFQQNIRHRMPEDNTLRRLFYYE